MDTGLLTFSVNSLITVLHPLWNIVRLKIQRRTSIDFFRSLPLIAQPNLKTKQEELEEFDSKDSSLLSSAAKGIFLVLATRGIQKMTAHCASFTVQKSKLFFSSNRTRVVPVDAFVHFLSHFQKEHCTEEEARQLVEVKLLALKMFL
jgi:hypothetical protein